MSDVWTVSIGGVTQSAAAWGIVGMAREREIKKAATVTFRVDGAMDAAPIVPPWRPGNRYAPSVVTILRNGVTWFVGVCTKAPRKGTPRSESMSYVISDPWFILERLTFQQQWFAIDGLGGGTSTAATTSSRILATQSLDGVKIDLGALLKEVLIYALYAQQGIAFPTSVDESHLPAIPSATAGTDNALFQIGTLTPDLIVPYFEVRDQTCAEIIVHLLRYLPDYVPWFDFTTTATVGGTTFPCPTLNIDCRANLTAKTIKVFGADMEADGYMVEGFDPTLRDDLYVPAVIAKYEASESADGFTYYEIVVDKYPPDAPDNAVGALVQTVDLIGGSVTTLKQTVSVVSVPTATNGSTAQILDWIARHCPALMQYDFSSGSFASVGIGTITTVIDPASPVLQSPISWPSDGAGLTRELVDGAVTPWMYDSAGLVCASATVTIPLTYTGSDAKTLAYIASVGGTLNVAVKCKITNAGGVSGWAATPVSRQYTATASAHAGETAPTGYAQQLFATLNTPHYQGAIEITEVECSDRLPLGCVFNASNGLAEWQSMNALVLSVKEDIDMGITRVQFGPTLHLGLQELVELRRANRGRLASVALQQRLTGSTSDGGNVVQGHNQSEASSAQLPPTTAQLGPFSLTYGPNPSNPSTYLVVVNETGAVYNVDGSPITVAGLGASRTLVTNDVIWLEGTVSGLACSALTLKSLGNGDTGYTNDGYWSPGSLTETSGSPPSQTLLRRVIAKFGSSASTPILTTQTTTTNLIMTNCNFVGEPAIYPLPN
jgi:hypothetical protein